MRSLDVWHREASLCDALYLERGQRSAFTLPPILRNSAPEDPLLAELERVRTVLLQDFTHWDKASDLEKRLRASCSRELRDDESSKMLPTFVKDREADARGTYLAVDIGGSTLRTAIVEYPANGSEALVSITHRWVVVDKVKQSSETEFFNWIALRVKETLVGYGHDLSLSIPMGLIFSFPLQQTGPNKALFLNMGKGYTVANDIIGKDIRSLFCDAFARNGIRVEFRVVVNDTAATLLSKRAVNPFTEIGLIMGTGCNAAVSYPAYMLGPKQRAMLNMQDSECEIINTELDQFAGPTFSPWDERLDAALERPGFQPIEQMVSGHYLGELVRLILQDLCYGAGRMFGGQMPPTLCVPYALTTRLVGLLENDVYLGNAGLVGAGSAEFMGQHPPADGYTYSSRDMQVLKALCESISTRSVLIVALSMVALLQTKYTSGGQGNGNGNATGNGNANGNDSFSGSSASSSTATDRSVQYASMENCRIGVAVTGSVMEKYPRFLERCQSTLEYMWQITGMQNITGAGIEMALTTENECLLGAAEAARCMA